MLYVEVITEDHRFDELEELWNPLLTASRADTLFLTYEWLRTWWKHYSAGKQLCILVFTEDDRAVAIAPLYKSRRTFGEIEVEMTGSERMLLPTGRFGGLFELPELSFLGTGAICSDFLDIFCLPGYEEQVAERLAKYLLHTMQDWTLLNLLDVADHSPVLKAIRACWRPESHLRWLPRYISYHAVLPGDYEAYLETLSRKSRYNARKKLREVERRHDSVRFAYHEDPQTLDTAMDEFIAMHVARWNLEGQPGVFVSDEFTGFHREMARIGLERGWLRLGFLEIDGKREFGLYSYRYHDRIYLYQQGGGTNHPRLNLGYAALATAIRAACEEGAAAYDFLRGDVPYKRHWAKAVRRLEQVQIVRPSPKGWLFQMHSRVNASSWLRRKAKRLLARGRR